MVTVKEATLIKLEMNDAMRRAIARCKQQRMRALRVNDNQVVVKSYTVNVYAPKPGLFLASCNCQATGTCKHIACACVVPGTAICEALNRSLSALDTYCALRDAGCSPEQAGQVVNDEIRAQAVAQVKLEGVQLRDAEATLCPLCFKPSPKGAEHEACTRRFDEALNADRKPRVSLAGAQPTSAPFKFRSNDLGSTWGGFQI